MLRKFTISNLFLYTSSILWHWLQNIIMSFLKKKKKRSCLI